MLLEGEGIESLWRPGWALWFDMVPELDEWPDWCCVLCLGRYKWGGELVFTGRCRGDRDGASGVGHPDFCWRYLAWCWDLGGCGWKSHYPLIRQGCRGEEMEFFWSDSVGRGEKEIWQWRIQWPIDKTTFSRFVIEQL